MSAHLCPVWIGRLLASPVRKLFLSPRRILADHVKPAMTVLDVGCAMGFFTVPMAKMVGDEGRIIAVDLQEGMLRGLRKRLARAEVERRVEVRRCGDLALGVEDLAGRVDFALAFAMVHEAEDPQGLIRQIHGALAEGGRLLIAEPRGHVSEGMFLDTLRWARGAGFEVVANPDIPQNRAVLLEKARAA